MKFTSATILSLPICSLALAMACGGAGLGDEQGAAIKRGEALYESNCLSCHGGSSGGAPSDVPPPHNANGHTWHHTDQLIIDIVLNGAEIPNYGWKMPKFGGTPTEDDVEDILAFIKTWWTEDQREFQATVTSQYEP